MLILRPLRDSDEAAFRAGHDAMAARGEVFGLGFTPGMDWGQYLRARREHAAGAGLTGRFVPNTFLAADVAGELVGRISIRHQLNDFLLREGGHIGYAVLPGYRRRGHATEILRQGLVVARSIGIERVLVTCDEANIASVKVIEACGGVLESVVAVENPPAKVRRYWIG